MNFLEQMSIGMLNSKLFFDEYSSNNQLQFAGLDLEEWVKKWIIDFENNHDYELESAAETITCTDKIIACKDPVSMKIFMSIIKKTVSDAYETKR